MIFVVVLIVLVAANAVTSVYLERLRAKERQFLLNAALSQTPYEFAVRQAATVEKRPVDEDLEPEILPEGL